MKKLKKFFTKRWVWGLFIAILTIPTFGSLLRPGFFPMQDDLQAFRVYEMDKCFSDFQIPCRWVPDAGYGYGYPQFNYYPPSVYYLGEVFHLIGFQFIDSVKILFALGYILSAVFMFLLVSEFLGNFPGFVSALIYTYVPYKAMEVYVRGALSEFWALVIYPLIFWAVYKLIKTSKLKYVGLLGISIGLLLTTHLLMSMIFFLPAAVWTLYWLIKEKKLDIKNVIKVASGVILGVSIAAFFVLPVLVEQKYAHTETMTMGYFGYLQHFVDLKRLFISREWGFGSSGFPDEKLNLSTGIVQWVFALVSIGIAGIYFLKGKKKDLVLLVITLGFLELFILFMIHVRSSFIWKAVPPLAWLQFPWRFLTVSIFILSILAGLGIKLLPKFKVWIGLAVIIAAFFLNISYYSPKEWLDITDKDHFSGISWQKKLTISIFDYLPIYAKLPPVTPAPEIPEVLDGEAFFSDYKKGSDFQIGDINVTHDATIRLPLFDFPGMQVKVNDEIISHNHDDCRGQEFCLGLITFKLPPGSYKMKAQLTDTPVRRVGNILSIFGVVITIYVLFKKDEKDTK